MAAYEKGSDSPPAGFVTEDIFLASAIRRLAVLYRDAGRVSEARAMLLKARANAKSGAASSTVMGSDAYLRIARLVAIGRCFAEIGDAADALQTFGEILDRTAEIDEARAYQVMDSLVGEATRGVTTALLLPAGMKPEDALRSVLHPAGPSQPPRLGLVVSPRQVEQSAVTSLFESAMKVIAKDSPTLMRLKDELERSAKSSPNDFEIQAELALTRCVGADPAAINEAARNLEQMATRSPLKPVPPGTRIGVPDQEEAARRLGFWLVARECWKQEASRDAGDRLASLAFEAARRQPEILWRAAMLRELGGNALARGDRKLAEEKWATLLELVLDRAKPGGSAASLTPERFEQAAALARLAAENGMDDLSMRAVRESLKGGPPVASVAMMPARAASRAGLGVAVETPEQKVWVKLVELNVLWTRNKVAPAAIYETLCEVLMPSARPKEIFLYARPSSRVIRNDPNIAPFQDPSLTRDAARLLAEAAVSAGKVDDLRARINKRRPTSLTAQNAAKDLDAEIEKARKNR